MSRSRRLQRQSSPNRPHDAPAALTSRSSSSTSATRLVAAAACPRCRSAASAAARARACSAAGQSGSRLDDQPSVPQLQSTSPCLAPTNWTQPCNPSHQPTCSSCSCRPRLATCASACCTTAARASRSPRSSAAAVRAASRSAVRCASCEYDSQMKRARLGQQSRRRQVQHTAGQHRRRLVRTGSSQPLTF